MHESVRPAVHRACAEMFIACISISHAPSHLGVRVLELGAGTGIPGLAAWVCGANEVMVTDLDESNPRPPSLSP